MSDVEDSDAVNVAEAVELQDKVGELGDDLDSESDDNNGRDDDDDGDGHRFVDPAGEIVRLQCLLEKNAYDYNSHVALIKVMRDEKDLQLTQTRKNMSKIFPLTEGLWLEWLKDEISEAKTDFEREKVYQLFENAVQDYVCPDVWLHYAQFSIGGIGQSGGIARVRAILERAIIEVGLHVTQGNIIWEIYREFENAILGTMQPEPGSVPTHEQQEEIKAQLQKIHSLYHRQLGVPLMDMESTLLEYQLWTEEPIPEAVLQNYTKALKQLQKYKPYEDALLIAEPPKLAQYEAYINLEMEIGDPTRIKLIYERALTDNCLMPDLWIRYTQYLDRKLKVRSLVLCGHRRAVRNCPWIVKLWCQYLLAMERHEVEHQVISETFEDSLKAYFTQATDYLEIWQAYLDYLRRRVDFAQDSSKELEELRSAFTRALTYLKEDIKERFNEAGDLSCILMQTWARIEACFCNNMEKARELWDLIMGKGNAKYANMWLEYYYLEREHGDIYHSTKALNRAVQCTQDYPEHICEILLTKERIEGTLESWDAAVVKTETRLARVKEQRAKAAAKKAALAKEEEKAEQLRQAEAQKALQRAQQPKAGKKRKADDEWVFEEGEFKTPRYIYEIERWEELELERNTDLEVELGLFPEAHDSKTEVVTVFVSNLPYSLKRPGTKLQQLFAKCGKVAEARPVFTNKGAFRGYGYVQFKDEQSVLRALELDRTLVDGRPMFVSPYVDKSKNPDIKVFKYSTDLELHKLFISGLPFSCTREDLEELCKGHGNVKDIRIVTNRAGKPKGLAYVEFEDEAQASMALLTMNGLTVKGHVIKVATSHPPSRASPEKPDSHPPSRALPKKPDSQGQQPSVQKSSRRRRKRKARLAMVPRAVQRHKAENGAVQNPPATPSPSGERPKKMTNADFAKMLLNK